jgi:hypothetical protein
LLASSDPIAVTVSRPFRYWLEGWVRRSQIWEGRQEPGDPHDGATPEGSSMPSAAPYHQQADLQFVA